MKKALLVLASIAAIAFAGCASSASPWATPDSAPPPVLQDSSSDLASPEMASDSYGASVDFVNTQPSGDLLADFPAIRKANLEKALAAIKSASVVEELPMPDKGNARITRYNAQYGVIEFVTPNTYAVGDFVVLTKEGKAALVSVIAIGDGRVVANMNAGVKGAPVLAPADYVLCDVYRTPEELEKIAAAQRKAQRDALAAARAAKLQEQALLAEDNEESEEVEEESSEDEESDDGSDDSSDEGEDDWGDDEEW